MTKIFDLVRKDYANVYADAMMAGTYEQAPRCPHCKFATRRRVPPLVIEWEPGSDVIGDFTWPGGLSEHVVSDQVKACFQSAGFSGVRFEPVEMYQKPSLKKPRRESKSNSRVWLPYSGPPLWNLVVTSVASMDLPKSGRSIVTECDFCNRTRMIVHDSEAPLVVRGSSWDGADAFTIREMRSLVFITEKIKQAIEKNAFTNVSMKERGYVENS